MYFDAKNIDDCITAYCTGNCSEAEKKILEEWVMACPEHRKMFERKLLENYWIYCAVAASSGELMSGQVVSGMERFFAGRKRLRRYRMAGIAAGLLLLVAMTWFFVGPAGEKQELMIAGKAISQHYGLLKIGDHEAIELGSNQQGELSDSLPVSFSIIRENREIVFFSDKGKGDTGKMLELDIVRGAEYKLTLEDGTKLFLNSASNVRFPEKFGPESREIEISGEVYLEVARDTRRPFIIKTDDFSVEVLGTTFGIRNYADEIRKTVTLVHGKVRVEYEGECTELTPGYQVLLYDGQLIKQKADMERELAWINGIFVFENEPLEEVLSGLSRWYDVHFEFEEPLLKEEPFTGRMGRDIGIDEILRLIERVNVVEFHRTEKQYIVKNKRQNRNNNQ